MSPHIILSSCTLSDSLCEQISKYEARFVTEKALKREFCSIPTKVHLTIEILFLIENKVPNHRYGGTFNQRFSVSVPFLYDFLCLNVKHQIKVTRSNNFLDTKANKNENRKQVNINFNDI